MNTDNTSFLHAADWFRFLANAFAYPSETAYQRVSELICHFKKNVPEDEIFKQYVQKLVHLLPTHEDLQREYSRVFIQGGLPVTESSITGRFTAVADVTAFYAAFGFSPRTGESPEALMYELEFVSILCLKIALAQKQEDREVTETALARFITEHLGDFTSRFVSELKKGDALEYYMTLGDILAYLMQNMFEFNPQQSS